MNMLEGSYLYKVEAFIDGEYKPVHEGLYGATLATISSEGSTVVGINLETDNLSRIMVSEQIIQSDSSQNADQIWLFDSETQSSEGYYQKLNGLFYNISTEEEADPLVKNATAITFYRESAAPEHSVTLNGKVLEGSSALININTGINLFSSPYTYDLDLNVGIDWSNATAGNSPSDSDVISVWDATLNSGAGGYIDYFLKDADGYREWCCSAPPYEKSSLIIPSGKAVTYVAKNYYALTIHKNAAHGVYGTPDLRLNNATHQLEWDSVPGEVYRIEACNNIVEGNWDVVVASLTAGEESISLDIPGFDSSDYKCFRLKALRSGEFVYIHEEIIGYTKRTLTEGNTYYLAYNFTHRNMMPQTADVMIGSQLPPSSQIGHFNTTVDIKSEMYFDGSDGGGVRWYGNAQQETLMFDAGSAFSIYIPDDNDGVTDENYTLVLSGIVKFDPDSIEIANGFNGIGNVYPAPISLSEAELSNALAVDSLFFSCPIEEQGSIYRKTAAGWENNADTMVIPPMQGVWLVNLGDGLEWNTPQVPSYEKVPGPALSASVSDTALNMAWSTLPFRKYRVTSSAALDSAGWSVATENIMTPNVSTHFNLSIESDEAEKYYRLEIERNGEFVALNEIIGYNSYTLSPGQSMIGYAYEESVTPSQLFGDELPIGTTVFKYDGLQQGYQFSNYGIFYPAPNYEAVTKWDDNITIERGDGLLVTVPADAPEPEYTVIAAGRVAGNSSTEIEIFPGMNLLAIPYPITSTVAEMNFIPTVGDTISVYESQGYRTSNYSTFYEAPLYQPVIKWSPDMEVKSHQGFWYQSESSFTWETIAPSGN